MHFPSLSWFYSYSPTNVIVIRNVCIDFQLFFIFHERVSDEMDEEIKSISKPKGKRINESTRVAAVHPI